MAYIALPSDELHGGSAKKMRLRHQESVNMGDALHVLDADLKILSRLLAHCDWLDAGVVAGDAVDQALDPGWASGPSKRACAHSYLKWET
ncbi:hypothetical protein TRIATDRAFT_321864 [Trichoderma atroviride IMI 206040]|uniref:Uncharacterized protein n=1 Tax=Hypocrea atroviridis (strain ATCC 20476 / IMI 206040) TaxID=452589 RepID=G9P806_HYPAI|nr:uncharacterized protein TRIATDRAFT_321864 [Trichoderma atroviride IMI 206040]EHK41693.1 hypothetical protein TRIATDRAFT_321864 [Trichoderma atroviride IMI 206040]